MAIIIERTSMIPVYEQIVNQFQHQIISGGLQSTAPLPSVRGLAKELHISALTVKKAYDELDSLGLVTTVQGKGSFVGKFNPEIQKEEQRKSVEKQIDVAVQTARQYGMTNKEIHEILNLFLEDK